MPITTPMFHASNSLYPTDVTQISAITGWSKLEIPAVGGLPAQHAILIAYNAGAGETAKQLMYDTAALRDTDYTALVAALSTSI